MDWKRISITISSTDDQHSCCTDASMTESLIPYEYKPEEIYLPISCLYNNFTYMMANKLKIIKENLNYYIDFSKEENSKAFKYDFSEKDLCKSMTLIDSLIKDLDDGWFKIDKLTPIKPENTIMINDKSTQDTISPRKFELQRLF